MALVTVKSEKKRITAILQDMPGNELELSRGLIEEAAWIRVKLKELRTDIDENGLFEPFQQSERMDPYDRERPQAKQYHAFYKDYENAIKSLLERCPPEKRESKLKEFMSGVR